jgi:hypothetical protein
LCLSNGCFDIVERNAANSIPERLDIHGGSGSGCCEMCVVVVGRIDKEWSFDVVDKRKHNDDNDDGNGNVKQYLNSA